MEERLRRNKTENRLNNKPSKRNIEFTEKEIVEDMKTYRLNSIELRDQSLEFDTLEEVVKK